MRLTSARGLITSSNELTRPDGALTVADNTVIDYENVIQQRRGFKEYSQVLLTPPKQLLTYKQKVLVHYGTNLAFDSSTAGTFTNFLGSYSELVSGLRIKSQEASGNLYFTTNEGVKVISAKSATEFPTTSIKQSGAVEATDLTAKAIPDAAGFLPAQSKVAYRLVFGYKDANSNLHLGSPSSRVVLTNFSQDAKTSEIFTVNIVDYTLIPNTGTAAYFLFDTIDSGYFVWFKRVSTQTEPISADTLNRQAILVDLTDTTVSYSNTIVAAVLGNVLANANIGLEVEISGTEVQVTVLKPGNTSDATQGTLSATAALVTKVFDGSITTGTPAKAELSFLLPAEVDTTYFYQVYRTAVQTVSAGITLNDVDPGDEHQFIFEAPVTSFDVSVGEITVEDITPEAFRQSGAYLYTNGITGEGITQANARPPIAHDINTFRNSTFYSNTKDYHTLTTSILSVDDFVSGATKFFVKKGTTTRTYTFVGQVEITDVTVLAATGTTENAYFILNSSNNERSYYFWIDKGAGVDPALTGKIGVRIPLELYPDTVAGSKQALLDSLLLIPDFTAEDYDVDTVRITCTDAGNVDNPTESVTPTGWTIAVVSEGDGEDYLNNEVFLSQSASVGVSIDLTARSLVRVINKDSLSPISATYLSGVDDLPGKILFKSKTLLDEEFYLAISGPLITFEFNPELPYWDEIAAFPTTSASDNNEVPNRVYYSKLNQPEAVPSVNYIDIGSKDKQILRILPLRDNLFALKEDGIFIITGSGPGSFSQRLLDNSAICIAPDSAVVLNNLIYCLSTQGVISISDSGVSIISRQIEDQIKKVTTFNYNYKYTSFGVSYESDRAYVLWLPTNRTDNVATQCFRYSTITNAWTRWTVPAVCGVVNYLGDDRMYLGGSGRYYVLQERKDNTREDYADRDFLRSLGEDSVFENTLTLSSAQDVKVGDVITQEQYLSVTELNRMLTKLNSDSGVSLTTYTNLLATQGSNLATILTNLVAMLNSDPNLFGSFTATSGINSKLNIQTDFNQIVAELNSISSGTNFKDYKPTTDLLVYEVEITEMTKNSNTVTVDRSTYFIEGEIRIYKAIKSEIEYAPQHFGKPEVFKQISEGTIIFDQGTISRASIGYASDRSLDFRDITFTLDGPGFWAGFDWGTTPWGGGSNERSQRTLIPQEKSRCRYLHVRFKHSVARQEYKLLGISLEPREYSTKAYR